MYHSFYHSIKVEIFIDRIKNELIKQTDSFINSSTLHMLISQVCIQFISSNRNSIESFSLCAIPTAHKIITKNKKKYLQNVV